MASDAGAHLFQVENGYQPPAKTLVINPLQESKQYMMAQPCPIENGRNHLQTVANRRWAMPMDPQMPLVHVRLLYQVSCQDAVFSATHGRSFVGVPKAALGSVLGCPSPRKKAKANQLSVSTMSFHPTKNLQKYPSSYCNGSIDFINSRDSWIHHGYSNPALSST